MSDFHRHPPTKKRLVRYSHFVVFIAAGLLLSNCTAKYARTASNATSPPSAGSIPKTYPTAQAYLHARQQLLTKDSLLDFDVQILLTSEEQQLNHKLVALRKQMITHYDSVHFFPPA